MKIIITSIVILNVVSLQAVDLSITQSGTYRLGRNLLGAPGNNDFVVQISANQVTLDLDGYTIQQNNANTNVNLIEIDAGVQEITIKNGRLLGSSGTNIAISIGDGAQQVTIDNMLIESCTSAVTGANNNRLIFMQDIVVNNFSRAAAILLFNFTSGTQIYAQDITITNNQSTADSLFCFNLNQISNSTFKNIIMDSNTAGISFRGVSLVGTTGSGNLTRNIFDTIICRFNQYSVGFNAFLISNCSNNIIKNSEIINNSYSVGASSTLCIPIQISQSSNTIPCLNNGVVNTNIINNTGQSLFVGVYILGSVAANSNVSSNYVDGCIIQNNVTDATAGASIGLVSESCIATIFTNNVIANNRNTATNTGAEFGIGLQINESTNCTVKGNTLTFNRHITNNTNSYGLRLVGTTTPYMITQNRSFNNGTTLANQLSGVAPNSQQNGVSPESQNLDSVTAPWTNVPAAT